MGVGRDPSTDDEEGRELALIAGVDRTRKEVHVLKAGAEGLEEAILRPVEEGKPLQGDLVRLHPRAGFPMLTEIETMMRHPDGPGTRRHNGPPMVASEAYRRGWDAIFGTRPSPSGDPDAN